jgi:hypothetical protein
MNATVHIPRMDPELPRMLEHFPEKWIPVFPQENAATKESRFSEGVEAGRRHFRHVKLWLRIGKACAQFGHMIGFVDANYRSPHAAGICNCTRRA